jgi:carboxymethylenebutenolidase
MDPSHPPGFLATPPSGTGHGVLVLHAWWGLNDTVKAFCTRLAGNGFVTFAPDLYHGKVADNVAAAEGLGRALDIAHVQAKEEILQAAKFVHERADARDDGIAVIGFSLGAFYALHLAATAPERVGAVVVFYGSGVDEHGGSRARYLGHFAENDPYEPQASVDHLEDSLRRAGRPVTFHRYAGAGHWFFEPDRAEAYRADAADLAWNRTLAFLQRPVRPSSPGTTKPPR